MSSQVSGVGRRLNARQAETLTKLLDAAFHEVRTVGFDAMTVRSVAARAEVATATAYTYVASKQHLVAELFWRELQGLPRRRAAGSALAQIQSLFADLVEFLVAEPQLASATTVSLLGSDASVVELRLRIGSEITSRLQDVLGDDAARVEALTVMWSGALLQAGLGYQSYPQMGDQLNRIAALILGQEPS